MPTISKVRFTNVQYEDGNKRYQDEVFLFEGFNSAILLENGGGKTVFIQSLIQSILPNSLMADRKMRDTVDVKIAPAHIAVEWILEESPREYAVTCITFYMGKDGLEYAMYCYEYREGNPHAIEQIPFVKETAKGTRPATREEIQEYYQYMDREYGNAHLFKTRREYQEHLEQQFHIVPSEWEAMLKINGSEGGVDHFFEGCKTMTQLVDKLLIPTVEQGLAVKGSEDFYKLFENHREHFREYLALGEQLQEYRRIDEEMQEVVFRYKQLDAAEREYRASQGKGKTVWLRMAQEQERLRLQLLSLDEQDETLKREQQRWQLRHDAIEVWKKKLQLQQSQREVAEYEPLYQQAERGEHTAQTIYRSLQALDFRGELHDAENRLQALQEQLVRLAQEISADEIEVELERALRQVAFLYDQRLSLLDWEQQAEQAKRTLVHGKLKVLAETQKGQQAERVSCFREESRLAERKRNLQIQMVEIEAEILLDREQGRVPHEVEKWQLDIRQVEQAKIDNMDERKTCKQTKQVLDGQLQRTQVELDEGNQERNKADAWLDQFDQRENELRQDLMKLLPEFSELRSVHSKEESIRHRVDAQIALLDKKVEDLLVQERLAYRFYDLYKENQVFTADPELEYLVEKLQLDIPALEVGTTYALRVVQEGADTLENVYDRYPYWPMTIIVTAHDIEKVKQRLVTAEHQWTHPIHLLTTAQAHAYLQGSWQESTSIVITPGQWLHLTERQSFQTWIAEQNSSAQEAKQNRIYFDRERRQHSGLADKVHSFFATYPYELLQEWRGHRELGQKKVRMATLLLESLQLDAELIDEELNRLEEAWKQLEHRSEDLARRIQKGLKWQSFAGQLRATNLELEQAKSQLLALDSSLAQLEQTASVWMLEVDQHTARIQSLQLQIDTLKREELYLRVSSKERDETEESHLLLVVRIRELDERKSGVVRQRNDLEHQVGDWQTRLQRLQQSLESHLQEFGDLVEPDFTYSGDLREAIKREHAVWQKARDYLQQVKTDYQKLHSDLETAKTVVRIAVEYFVNLHGDRSEELEFGDQPLEALLQDLRLQQDEVRDRQAQSRKARAEARSLQDEVSKVYRELEILAQKNVHGFQQAELSELPLEQEEERSFPYGRMEFVKQLHQRLDEQLSKVGQARTEVRTRREKFERNLQQVREERIRQRTLDGLKLKTTYSEMQEWADLMHERIHDVLNIVEQQQRESDRHVQHVILHLHSHVQNICQELREIPRMTRVRFANGVKDIFDFTVPTWTEEEGLLRLRAHLEWMMRELEDDRFSQVQGGEDKDKVRKQVENWLHPTQLLQVINSAHEIKVRCRKVTNDKLVANSYTEWPDTENWSGGEKWSKNMTLFLGVLNYLAEKRGHLRTGKKNYRVVICDNPFGKASSDHVLSPVFHIAKQLGFQFLALTAHAEGKFLRDYFPILYSCRLRPTKDPSIRVMQKEKKIRKAFFQDQAPQALERLGEQEQLTMLL